MLEQNGGRKRGVGVWGGCQQFRGPGGPILERKRSATEINEVQFSKEHQSHWCRPQAATQTSPSDKPQLPRCNVLLSKSKE